MKRPALKMNACNMMMWTELSSDRVRRTLELAEKMTADSEKKDRLMRHECIACYYESRVGGSAITVQPCMSCGKDVMYASSSTDALCLDCARLHDLCKHCGGDIGMRVRRKKWPRPVADCG